MINGYKKIAGRGAVGDANWGANFDQSNETIQKWLAELQKNIGKTVLLSGGGGNDTHLGILAEAKIVQVDHREKKAIQVTLKNLTPKIAGESEFTPYLDSWQISVKTEG